MKKLHSVLAIVFAVCVCGVSHAQTDVASEADQLIVAGHGSVKLRDAVSAGKQFPRISESNVSYTITQKEGIHLTVLTRSPEKYAERVSELKKTSGLEIKFGLPPLSRNDFSFDELEKYRSKNGVVVFLRADWCVTCDFIENKELQKQSLLKFLYDSNVPILWADNTNSLNGNGPVGKFAKEMKLNTVPAFVVYSPHKTKPMVLTDVSSGEQIEKALRQHLVKEKQRKNQ